SRRGFAAALAILGWLSLPTARGRCSRAGAGSRPLKIEDERGDNPFNKDGTGFEIISNWPRRRDPYDLVLSFVSDWRRRSTCQQCFQSRLACGDPFLKRHHCGRRSCRRFLGTACQRLHYWLELIIGK